MSLAQVIHVVHYEEMKAAIICSTQYLHKTESYYTGTDIKSLCHMVSSLDKTSLKYDIYTFSGDEVALNPMTKNLKDPIIKDVLGRKILTEKLLMPKKLQDIEMGNLALLFFCDNYETTIEQDHLDQLASMGQNRSKDCYLGSVGYGTHNLLTLIGERAPANKAIQLTGMSDQEIKYLGLTSLSSVEGRARSLGYELSCVSAWQTNYFSAEPIFTAQNTNSVIELTELIVRKLNRREIHGTGA